MNRVITEPFGASLPPERQNEFFHRYMLGVYDLYARLTERFPDILFESCAGGGGRNDPGMLAFAPQAWTSDDTDAVERQTHPVRHLAGVPARGHGRARLGGAQPPGRARDARSTTRAAVAFFGNLGYELDPRGLDEVEHEQVRAQIAWYKERRELLHQGRFHRLMSPFEGDGNETAWMVVGRRAQPCAGGLVPHAVACHCRVRRCCACGASTRPPATGSRVWPEADDWVASRQRHGAGR